MERDGLVAALGHMHSTAFPRFPAASVPGNVMFHNGGIFNETSIGSDNIGKIFGSRLCRTDREPNIFPSGPTKLSQ